VAAVALTSVAAAGIVLHDQGHDRQSTRFLSMSRGNRPGPAGSDLPSLNPRPSAGSGVPGRELVYRQLFPPSADWTARPKNPPSELAMTR
jgi:hypothetical protein